jgi:hypothetical protein
MDSVHYEHIRAGEQEAGVEEGRFGGGGGVEKRGGRVCPGGIVEADLAPGAHKCRGFTKTFQQFPGVLVGLK